jgi:glucose-1-phosphate thymidylyltransferase
MGHAPLSKRGLFGAASDENFRPGSLEMKKAVILARGLGKRMRAPDRSAPLAAEQARAAGAGMKAMIPIGRPFLDFVLSALADAGLREICLVVGPEHTAIRDYYAALPLRRVRVSFAIQEDPIGTANALLAAKSFLAADPFLVLNSDNYYPVEVFRAMRELGEPGLPVFERESLVRESNIPRERVLHYALLEIGADGYLEKIIEKPEAIPEAPAGREIFISMNCWRFDSAIFRACERVPRSARGEFELPEAVQFGLATLGLRFKTVPFRTGVLDLSQRADIASVAQRLAGARVEL